MRSLVTTLAICPVFRVHLKSRAMEASALQCTGIWVGDFWEWWGDGGWLCLDEDGVGVSLDLLDG